MVTSLSSWFSLAARDVYEHTQDTAVAIPEGFSGGSLDFAGSPMAWLVFEFTHNLKWFGAGVLVLITGVMMWWNRVNILRNRKEMAEKGATTIQTTE